MHKTALVTLVTLSFLVLTLQRATADAEVGLSVSSNGISAFHLSVGRHYHCSEADILLVRKHHVTDDELPVVFYLATRASVSPNVILDLRHRGRSWMDITLHFGLTAEVFYVPVTGVYGPPYGRAYGYFKKKKRKHWGTIRLTDREAVHLVNLKFLSEHHGHPPDKIISMRQKGDNFVRLHARVKKHKATSIKHEVRSSRRSAPHKIKVQQRSGSHSRVKVKVGGPGKGKGGRRRK